MGCDIHLYVEVYNETKQAWEEYVSLIPNPNYVPIRATGNLVDIYRKQEFRRKADEWGSPHLKMVEKRFYEGRSYSLFSLLADVRNDGTIEPISEPKGLPDDLSPEIQKLSDEWGIDGHSHSYFTLGDLLDVDWTGSMGSKCVTDDLGWYRKWYSEFIVSDNKNSLTLNNCKALLAGSFMDTIEDLKEIGKPPENIRIVFWFDN